MEHRLFHRAKALRFVRPHRVELFEWVSAVRHNIFCDIIHMFDRLRGRLRDYRAYVKNLNKEQELFPLEESRPLTTWEKKLHRFFRRHHLLEEKNSSRFRAPGLARAWWPLLFVVGLTAGFGLKWWAEDRITIGYEDYRLPASEAYYDLNALQENFLREENDPTPGPEKTRSYPACSIQ